MVSKNRRWHYAGLAAIALVTLALPRLITAAPLDLLAHGNAKANQAEDARTNFPGSAFFFAQDMIDRLPSPALDRNGTTISIMAAPATAFRGLTPLDSYRALNCLTSAVYYEAGNEPEEGQRAVAQVVLNRVRSRLWPRSICAVVYQGSERTDLRCQFTFSCDGSLARRMSSVAWVKARRVAQQALGGRVYAPVGLATFYHTLAVRPGWAASVKPVAIIGAHIFYEGKGVRGSAAGFRMRYTGREYQSGPTLRNGATPWTSPSPSRIGDQGPVPAAPILPSPDLHPSREAALPDSTVRPEYLNSGRPRV